MPMEGFGEMRPTVCVSAGGRGHGSGAVGHVIGINTMIAGGIGLAVPGNTFSRFLRSESRSGVVARSVEIARTGCAISA